MSYTITSQCQINDQQVILNDNLLVQRTDEGDWLADVYHAIGMQYPKFFKMDNLCKAGTLATELLLRDLDFDRENVKPDWAVILMNSASSLDDDRKYQQTIADAENYYPSPAVFVYTLANIVTGEICIRHKIGGESSFYIFEQFDETQMHTFVQQAFASHPELTHIICGWVDVDGDTMDVRMWLVVKV